MKNKRMTVMAVGGGAVALAAVMTVGAAKKDMAFTPAEIEAAQTAWAEGIVAIGATKTEGGDYSARAAEHIRTLYAYGKAPVLFKPTKAAEEQFRDTYEEAHSYFVGGDIKEDGGFAINPWTAVRFENEGLYIDSDSAVAMGNYYFTTPEGQEVKVEYTFGYIPGKDGQPLINVHHSSLPFSP
ncbi:phosphoribosyl-AMP cyclohydrolase [Algiphilus sp.]|uniref:phosphoribosyl-AMP cyclohydrolase n=1 Tax=Algiphilus sp. TaxID=1872431 RepID=UPI003B52E33C